MSSTFYIAYCEANKSVAKDISTKLSRAKIKFIPLSSADSKNEQGLTFLIAETKVPGILLLSENFLKNGVCMQNMLSFVQTSAVAEKMQIVVIDGKTSTGQTVETSFDRVSNVIQYMNYWQEQYLEMRKKKRSVDPSKADSFNLELQNVKNISSEIGDFLRVIRNKNYWSYDQLVFNSFEAFFNKYLTNTQHQVYKTYAAKDPKPKAKPSNTIPPVSPTVPKVEAKEQPVRVTNPVSEKKDTKHQHHTKPTTPPVNPPAFKEVAKKTVEDSEPVLQNELTGSTVLSNFSKSTENKKKSINEIYAKKSQVKKEEKAIDEILEEVENYSGNTFEKKELLNTGKDQKSKNVVTPVSKDHDSLQNVFTEENEEAEDSLMESPGADHDPEANSDDDFDVMDGVEIDDLADEQDEMEDLYDDDEDEILEINPDELMIDRSQQADFEKSAAISSAHALMMNGARKKGIEAFETLLEKYPNDADLMFQYGLALKEESNNIDRATILFEKVVKINPEHAAAYKVLAEIAEQNNDFLLAKSYYESVVELRPEEKNVYYKLGLITAGFYSEKPKLAAKYFKKAIKQDLTNEDAYYRLALLQSEYLGKERKALDNFLKTLKINPEHPFANYDLALLFHKLGDKKDAAVYYKKAWEVNSELKTPENDAAFHYQENEAPIQQTQTDSDQPASVANDKIIFITGATSGIGLATAKKFAENGFRIIATGRRADRLEQLKTDFANTYNTKIKTLNFDVRNLDAVKSMIENLEEEWKNVDVLINNAGLAKGYAPIQEGEIEHWETMIDTNIKGLLYLTRAITPHMVKRKSGHIINVCSSAAKDVYPNGNVYCATKFAVEGLTKAMRLDLYKHNIRVGQVSPSHVEETEFAYVRYEDKEKAKIYEDFQPLKSSDVAEAIYYMVNTPAYVNISDIILSGTQQASNNHIDRSGR